MAIAISTACAGRLVHAAENTSTGRWLTGFHMSGFNERVYSLSSFGGNLVAGGLFTRAGPVRAAHIALLESTGWRGIADDGRAIRSINAVVEFNGQLAVAGDSDEASISIWDGSSWRVIGLADAPVDALAVFQGNLVAGGLFRSVNGMAVNGIAMWNGESWTAVGGGVAGHSHWVHALLADDENLVAGGLFDSAGGIPAQGIASWNGSDWRSIGSVTGIGVRALTKLGSDLIAAGSFSAIGGVRASSIARWDGVAWHPLGEGLSSASGLGSVQAICVFESRLIAGGSFTVSGSAPALHVAAWDGSSWSQLGDGVRRVDVGGIVTALHVHDGALFIGGDFHVAGQEFSPYLARWRDGGFEVESPGNGLFGGVWKLEASAGHVYAGGTFVGTGSGAMLARVAGWNGTSWQPLGAGFNGRVTSVRMSPYGLIAAGDFVRSDTASTPHIARWNDRSWESLGAGLDGRVWDVEVFDGKLVAAGEFSAAGPTALHRVAQWDGQEWVSLGTAEIDGVVSCLEVYRDELYAGGAFRVGDPVTIGVARWTGSSWTGVGPGVNAPVRALKTWKGKLVLGGVFDAFGDGTQALGIATWDGDSLASLSAQLLGFLEINTLEAMDEALFAGGIIYPEWNGTGPPPRSAGVACFERGAWSILGGGVDNIVTSMTVCGGDLWIGGRFEFAGGFAAKEVAVWRTGKPHNDFDLLGSWDGEGIMLEWRRFAGSVGDTLVLERSENPAGPYEPILKVPASQDRMRHLDRGAVAGRVYSYRLSLAGQSGLEVLGIVEVLAGRAGPGPQGLAAGPSRGGGYVITFKLAADGYCNLRVLDVKGRLIKQLVDSPLRAGPQSVIWDRTSDAGTRIASGIYFVSLRDSATSSSRKLVVF